MGIKNRNRGIEKRVNLNNPQVPLSGGTLSQFGGDSAVGSSPYGVVTPEVALQFSAFFAGVRVISETIASLPAVLYKTADEGKVRATNHYLYPILHDNPNNLMSSYTWREVMISSAILRGDHFSYIERDAAGRLAALLPLNSNDVEIGVVDGKKVYKLRTWVQLPGVGEQQRINFLPDEDVIHVMGATFDGIRGVSIIRFARNSIGIGLAAEHHGAQFFSQGTTPSGIITTTKKLDLPVMQRLKQSWESSFAGIKGAHRVPILEEGMDFKPISLSPEDSQWLQSRKFQVEEIARWLRIPPHKIGSLDRATNNNIEQQALEFIQDTIRPWIEKVEQELERKLLTPAEYGNYFLEFNLDALLRADMKTRYESYAIGKQWGWLNSNEIRERENLNKLPGDTGEIYISPLNMVNSEALLQLPAPPAAPAAPAMTAMPEAEDQAEDQTDDMDEMDDADERSRAVSAASISLADSLGRMIRKEGEALKRANVDPEAFYGKHEATPTEAIAPALRGLAVMLKADAQTAQDFAGVASRRYCRQQLENRSECVPDELAASLAAELAALIPKVEKHE